MIDMHAHYVSPRLFELNLGSTGVVCDATARTFEFPSGFSRPNPVPLTDLQARAEWIGSHSIDRQILSPWLDLGGDDLKPAEAAAWCRLLNDATAADIAADERFGAFATLPMADGVAAAEELARVVEQLGFQGAAIPANVAGVDLDRAGLDPLFEAALSLDVPLFIHPFRGLAPGRLSQFFLNNVAGIPFETTVAALRLFFSGTLERWPGMKLVLAHAGGALPLLAGRAAHASGRVPLIERELHAPDELLDHFYYDTVLHDAGALRFVAQRVGIDRMVAGTDVPFPMLIDSVSDHLRQSLAGTRLGEDALDRVMRTTPERILSRRPESYGARHISSRCRQAAATAAGGTGRLRTKPGTPSAWSMAAAMAALTPGIPASPAEQRMQYRSRSNARRVEGRPA